MMYNPYSLENKTILVTGASSGIGRATAIECSKLGAKLIVTARNEERLKSTLDALNGDGHQMILADLTSEDDVERMVNLLPQLDGLVNDAGILNTKPISFIKKQHLTDVFEINTFAPILLTKSLLKKKKMCKESSIVMVSSLATMVAVPGNTIYAMAKSAVKTFSEYCALEFAGKGIRVNSVHPGMINTEAVRQLPLSAEDIELDQSKYPLKRYGSPEEVAWSIIYLLSDATKWVTGTQLIIDGGVHLI